MSVNLSPIEFTKIGHRCQLAVAVASNLGGPIHRFDHKLN